VTHQHNGPHPCGVPRGGGRTAVQSPQPVPQPARPQSLHRAASTAPTEEAVIVTAPKPASWSHSEEYIGEDEVLANARARAEEVGVVPIGSGAGAALRFLASVLGLWMLRGMRPDGVLTSVDTEAEHQRRAKETFTEAGIPQQRARLIPGAALEVLPRLTDGHYDLVFADGDKQEYPEYLAEALRLLRPGGVVAFDNALWHDRVADPAQRDPDTIAIRELGRIVREDDALVPVLLPVGDGLLLAKKVWTPEG
jgi:SAM-dependent methyltransferase